MIDKATFIAEVKRRIGSNDVSLVTDIEDVTSTNLTDNHIHDLINYSLRKIVNVAKAMHIPDSVGNQSNNTLPDNFNRLLKTRVTRDSIRCIEKSQEWIDLTVGTSRFPTVTNPAYVINKNKIAVYPTPDLPDDVEIYYVTNLSITTTDTEIPLPEKMKGVLLFYVVEAYHQSVGNYEYLEFYNILNNMLITPFSRNKKFTVKDDNEVDTEPQ